MDQARRIAHRMVDMLDAIADIRDVISNETFESFAKHRIKRPAIERYLEIISEASRHIPVDIKTRDGRIPWQKIANLGNILRHAYHTTNPEILWDICQNHLSELEAAVRRAQPEFPNVSDPPS